jgi:tetratricopeptide (TPR) repeat protein
VNPDEPKQPKGLDLQIQKTLHRSDDNQRKATYIAEAIKVQASRGVYANLQLAQLQDIPLVTIESPLFIARSLLSVLGADEIWTNKFRFQLRYTLARLARRYIVDYILSNPKIYKANRRTLKIETAEIKSMVAVQSKCTALDSGVRAEVSIIHNLVNQVSTNTRWWEILSSDASVLLEAYSSKDVGSLVVKAAELAVWFKDVLSKESLVERSLLIDRLYILDGPTAAQSFLEIMQGELTWETQYMALAYLEWGIHRNKFTTSQLETFRPTFEHLLQLKRSNVNEKLATILLKLKEQGLFSDLLACLRAQDTSDLVATLMRVPVDLLAPEPKVSALSNTSPDSPVLYGRDTELSIVKQRLMEEKYLAIAGLAGMGKSMLGLKVAEECVSTFDIVWVLNAETESDLETSLVNLGTYLWVEVSAKDKYRMLHKALLSYNQVLLVFDNAVKLIEPVYELFKGMNMHLLLTTRDETFEAAFILRGWQVEVAVRYLTDITHRTEETKELEALCVKLSCAPLALKVASVFIQSEKTMPLKELLGKLDEDLAYIEDSNLHQSYRITKMISECVHKAVEAYAPTRDFLLMCAFLSPNSVPHALYSRLFIDISQADLRLCKRNAKVYSLFEEDEDQAISMHRLVQQTVLSAEAALQVLPLLTKSIATCLSDKGTRREVLRSTKSVLYFVMHRGLLDEYGEFCMHFLHMSIALKGVSLERTKMLLDLLHWLDSHQPFIPQLSPVTAAEFAVDLNAAGLSALALKIAAQIEAEVPDQKMELHRALGTLYMSTSEWDKAEAHFSKCLADMLDSLGPKHHDTAGVYNDLGIVCMNKGDWATSEDYCLKCLSIWQETLEPVDLELSKVYNNLGILYKHTNDIAKSLKYYQKCLQIRQIKLPPKHPDIALIYNNLGNLYRIKRDFPQSEECYGKCLGIMKEIYGADHAELAVIYNNLGVLFSDKGDTQQADENFMMAMHIKLQTLEPNDPEISALYKHLASLYDKAGDTQRAEEYRAKSMEESWTARGPISPA